MGNPFPDNIRFDERFSCSCAAMTVLIFCILVLNEPVGAATPGTLPDGAWDHVTITNAALAPAYRPLAAHRKIGGLASRVVTLTEIHAWTGVDDRQEAVRAFVAAAAADWGTRYVLLGGDGVVVPVPRGVFRATMIEDERLELDLYYVAPGGIWDADGDGILGEPGEDEPDLTSVASVGRVPTSDPRATRAYVRKLIAYEKPVRDEPRPGLLAAEVSLPRPWQPGQDVIYDLATQAETAALMLDGWAGLAGWDRLYQNTAAWAGSQPLGLEALRDALAGGGYGLLHVWGHGDVGVWSLGDQLLRRSDLEGVALAPEPMLAVAMTPYSAAVEEGSILADLVLAPGGGCVAAVGPSTLFFIAPGADYCEGLWTDWAGDGALRLGDAHRAALDRMAASFPDAAYRLSTIETMRLLGDPATLLRPEPRRRAGPPRHGGIEAVARPNPFNPAVEFVFQVPDELDGAAATVDVFDLAGRHVRRLLDDEVAAGERSVRWGGTDADGRTVSAGVYLARITVASDVAIVRAVLAN